MLGEEQCAVFLLLGPPEWGDHLGGLGVGTKFESNGILRNGMERGEMDLSGSFRDNMRLIIKFVVNFRISWNVKKSLTKKLLVASEQELCSMELDMKRIWVIVTGKGFFEG